ncbi:MAG: hypothetical protein ABS46_15035 [Cytophagaceae bacterium SCN 52-12]|nr:MAG: hypothetical protein ABS46_15035 [Cytophagaceae bacterium SCN 52-12]
MSYSAFFAGLTALLALSSPSGSESAPDDSFVGEASYYSARFEGKKTAFGEIFCNKHFTAAHRTFAYNTLLEVINLKNGKSVVVRVNDRGPWTKRRMIDISQAAARKLGLMSAGTGSVKVRVVGEDGTLFEKEKNALSAVFHAGMN